MNDSMTPTGMMWSGPGTGPVSRDTAPPSRTWGRSAGRRIPGVLLAAVFLTIATMGIAGDPFWLINRGTPWVAAGVLALLGIGLIGSTLPGVRRR